MRLYAILLITIIYGLLFTICFGREYETVIEDMETRLGIIIDVKVIEGDNLRRIGRQRFFGLYDVENNIIYIQKGRTRELIHEVCHWVDYKIGTKGFDYSYKAITDYARTDKFEYFAESCTEYFKNPKLLREKQPKNYGRFYRLETPFIF